MSGFLTLFEKVFDFFLEKKKKKNAGPCNFTKSNTPPWVFFTFFKLHKWYQILQSSKLFAVTITESWEQSKLAFTYSRLTIETLEQGVKYIQIQ